VSDPWGETSSAQPHQPRPSGPSYGQQPPSPYPQPAYGQQPYDQQYGQQPPGSSYGQQPSGSQWSQPPGQAPQTPAPKKKKGFFRDPLSIVLVVVIVLALSGAGLVAAELIARNIGEKRVALAACRVVEDSVDVSFGATPFLLQYSTDSYSNINITTGGNQVRQLKGLKAQIQLEDVDLQRTADSRGTIGALHATITWAKDGLNETIRNEVPVVGGLIDVTPNPSDGTLELSVPLASVVVKPSVSNGNITMQVVDQSGLATILGKDDAQIGLDKISSQLGENYPLGIKADSIAVTNDGLVAQFSTTNAKIPNDGAGSMDDSQGEQTPAVCQQYT
jgi:hypothetical protein